MGTSVFDSAAKSILWAGLAWALALPAGLALAGCQTEGEEALPPPSAAAAPAEAQADPLGARVNVGVAGRGVVVSDPAGLRCGNDGDQRACDLFFPLDPTGKASAVKLTALPFAGWTFTGWRVVPATGSIAYDLAEVGDPRDPVLTVDGRAKREEDGRERAGRYRVEAVFAATDGVDAEAVGEVRGEPAERP